MTSLVVFDLPWLDYTPCLRIRLLSFLAGSLPTTGSAACEASGLSFSFSMAALMSFLDGRCMAYSVLPVWAFRVPGLSTRFQWPLDCTGDWAGLPVADGKRPPGGVVFISWAVVALRPANLTALP